MICLLVVPFEHHPSVIIENEHLVQSHAGNFTIKPVPVSEVTLKKLALKMQFPNQIRSGRKQFNLEQFSCLLNKRKHLSSQLVLKMNA